MKKLIVISDWAGDSLSCQEVRTATEGYLNNPDHPSISFVSSTPSTIHTTFLLAQVVEVENRIGRPMDTVIFIDTDTRTQTDHPIIEAEGSELMIARLKSGLYVIGPNAGNSFTMIKDQIDAAFQYPGMSKGSQFRSRDMYARVTAHLMESMQDDMDLEEAHLGLIPEFEGFYIGHIDNYGNIKTTIPEEHIKESYKHDDMIDVTMNGISRKARYVDNMFGTTKGELIIYPGSSGTTQNSFMEVSIRRDFAEEHPTTGYHEFGSPKPGMKVEISR